jgi:predicted acylesterase/phospholipase RssA
MRLGRAAPAEHWNWVSYIVGALAGIGALAAASVMTAVALGLVAFRYANHRLPKNFFGICSGGDDKRDRRYASEVPPPLGHWMAETINELSGKKPKDPNPLTFGDLWGAGKSVRDANLRLQVMTTDLSRSRPYHMPFDDDELPFYFSETEFRRLFPNEVVTWMVERSKERIADDKKAPKPLGLGGAKYRGHLDLLPFPLAKDLPIVVATRMSMSFPVLLGAVPLYTIEPAEEGGTQALRHWFSDGGMCSNFPIHLFDSPLPRWPTFGINLRYFDEKRRSTRGPLAPPLPNRSYLPASDGDQKFSFNFPIDESDISSFFTAIKSAMQNWLDFAQMDYPGFRDRIAQVYLDSKEGGMNLNMPGTAIAKLANRGTAAAKMLADQFAPDSTVQYTWAHHQEVRFRTFMRLTEDAFRAYGRNYASQHFAALMAHDPTATAWGTQYCDLAQKFETAVAAPGAVFDNAKAPRPYAIFRIMPDV